MCGCGSVSCTQCTKGEGWEVLRNGQKAGGSSLRVKRDERVGVWWLDVVDVSVIAWCQTPCHCQCLPHQPIPQWSATVQCVSKPLLPLQSVCWCCCVVPLFLFLHSLFSFMNGFGDDVTAAQPSHPCLVIHSTVSHVTPRFHCQKRGGKTKKRTPRRGIEPRSAM